MRWLYAIRLAGRDDAKYRRVVRIGMRVTYDTLDPKAFDEYVAWLDGLEQRYPGKLDVIVEAYRRNSPSEPSFLPTFDEILRAYEERAAALDRGLD